MPMTISQLRVGFLSDVLRYTLDRGVFIVVIDIVVVVVIVVDVVISCGNDADRIASALFPLLGIVWERSGEADACVGEEHSLPSLLGIVVFASSRIQRSRGARQRGRTEIVRASLVPWAGTNEAFLNPQLGKREKKAQVKS